MGLQASVEFHYPTETPELGIPIDYADAIMAFCESFTSMSQGICPVDTGFLRSTINAAPDDDLEATCEAGAEYAQYVEYGTYKMGAQPYFEPALNAAIAESLPLFDEIFEEAMEEEEDLLEEMEEEAEKQAQQQAMAQGADKQGSSFMNWMISTIAAAIVAALIAMVKAIFSTDNDSSRQGRGGGGDLESGGGSYTISIT